VSSTGISLEDLKNFYGELKDGEDSQKKFRDFISKEKWKLNDFQRWLDEAVQRKLPKEFQDIVTLLGKRLGFNVEFGYYSQMPGKTPYDGLWESDKLRIVIETKLGTWIRYDINQLGEYLDRVSSERGGNLTTYGMYVVGQTEDLGPLSDQVRGNRYANRIRIISHVALLKLVEICERTPLENEQVSKILIPFDAVNVGELVELIQMLVEEVIGTEGPGLSPSSSPPLAEVPNVSRSSVINLEEGNVVICPSKPEGVDFLKQYQAWGFVRIKREPRYFALYVSSPKHAITHFGEVEKVVDPKYSRVANPEEYSTYKVGKKVIQLKVGSLRELSDPITKGTQRVPQGIWYTTLSKFLHANTLDDL
jgi:hypothetical protein